MPVPLHLPKNAERQRAHKRGLSAETLCAWWLRLKGYRVLATRLSTPLGEIDVVARKRNTLAIIEVKARKSEMDCMESITSAKQQRLVRAAHALLANPGQIACGADIHTLNIRFDVMMVLPSRLPRHLTDAWRA